MSIVLSVMFALTAAIAVAVIWNTISANMGAIAHLRRQVALPNYGSEIIVTLRENDIDIDPVAIMRRARHLRHPLPKPITHRLHQFVKARSAA